MSEEPSPQSRQDKLDRDAAEFEAMGGSITYYKTLSTKQIIQCMKDEAESSLWNSSEIADLEERKRLKGKAK